MQRGKCDEEAEDLSFKVVSPVNDVGTVWLREKDKDRFMDGQNGDLCMSPFQRDIYQTGRKEITWLYMSTEFGYFVGQ